MVPFSFGHWAGEAASTIPAPGTDAWIPFSFDLANGQLTGLKSNLSASPFFFFSFFLVVFNCGWMVFLLWLHAFQKHQKSNPLQTPKCYLLQSSCFLFKIIFSKRREKHVHKGYPLAGPCICNFKLELAFAKKSASPVFFILLPCCCLLWLNDF